MKIFNIKLDKQKIRYIFLIFLAILLASIVLSLFINNHTLYMNNSNYTTILQDSHLNISKYIGKKIVLSGYIFRMKDFESNKFVIARDMLINNTQANIVGFLCEYEKATDFEDNVWVEAHGTIDIGEYYGPIPIVKIDTIRCITTPNDTFVYPPK